MKTVLFDLLDIINNNFDHIENKHPNIGDILHQIDTLIKKNPSNNEILEWMLSNEDSIKNINKCLKNIKNL